MQQASSERLAFLLRDSIRVKLDSWGYVESAADFPGILGDNTKLYFIVNMITIVSRSKSSLKVLMTMLRYLGK